MASELQCDHDADANIYFIVRRASDGRVWNGASFVDYETADYADYAIAATEQGVQSGFYVADMPSVAEGLYSVVAKDRAGMSPAETDRTIGVGTISWSGTAVLGGNTGSAIRSAVGLASADLDTQLSGIAANVTTLLSRVTATLFSGITSLADWLRRMARKDTGTSGMATAQTEINTGGSPTFSGVTDSLEGVRDALDGDARGEPGQESPPVSATVARKIDYLYKAWRNKSDQTDTQYRLFNSDNTTVDQKASVTDDGTVTTRGTVTTGP